MLILAPDTTSLAQWHKKTVAKPEADLQTPKSLLLLPDQEFI